MSDNLDDQLDDFFRKARATKPDTSRIEFGFETRLLARIRVERDSWSAWSWRLCPLFAALVVALGLWSWVSPSEIELSAVLASKADEVALVKSITGKRI